MKNMSENGPQINPLIMRPFSLGWTREVVKRVVTRGKIPNYDIYYISPSKKKFRSMNEIRSNLTGGLSLECFSFKKEPLGLDPNHETIRDAKARGRGVENPKGKGTKKPAKTETSEQETEVDKKEIKKETEEEVSKPDAVENGANADINTVEEGKKEEETKLEDKKEDDKKKSEINSDTKTRRQKPDGKECNESKTVDRKREVKAKPTNLTRSVRLQSLKRKKILKRVMTAKQAKQAKVVPGSKVLKKIISKKISGPRQKLSKSPNVKKAALKRKKNISVKLKTGKKPLKKRLSKAKNEPKGAKESETNDTDKKTRDLKSIVKKNIGKYREMREKQKLGVVKNQLKSPSRKLAVSNVSRGEPISKNQTYLKPLEKGWKRELVYRSNSTKKGQLADVYYFHPSGKKLRSCREIAENLTHGLSMDCFTFRKEPIGCGEPSEVIRNARPIKRTDSAEKGKNWR